MLRGYKKGCVRLHYDLGNKTCRREKGRSLPVVLDLVAFVQKHDVPIDGDKRGQLGGNVAVRGEAQPALVMEHLEIERGSVVVIGRLARERERERS